MKKLVRHLFGLTPQSSPLPGSAQVLNHAGGYVFEVGPWTRLARFLVLGSSGGTFYTTERALTRESAVAVLECLALDPQRTVEAVVRVSTEGRAPSNTPALFALGLAFCEPRAVDAARAALPAVARTASHLFEFLTAVRAMRGFGRALRGAVADWYLERPTDALAYQLVKYRNRSGWTHRDVLRIAHPKVGAAAADAVARRALLAWAVGKDAAVLPSLVRAFVDAQTKPLAALPALVREQGLTHEMVPSEALRDRAVLEALYERMPLGALVRFLGRLSKAGVLAEGSDVERAIVARLTDRAALVKARLHPMVLLVALRTYAAGRGIEGKLSWPVSGRVCDALSEAFHLAFANVVPSGKRILLAVDVSGSMGGACVAGSRTLTCAEAAAALALVTLRTEQSALIKAFDHQFRDLPISPGQRLDDVLRTTRAMAFGATDCALPMRWALESRKEIDTFVVLTDSETWYGDVHPCRALEDYRRALGIEARLVVVALTGTQFSIADPNDPLCLDVVGFDTTTPQVITDFAAGRI
jgi:60 kDa SS-A/Ro ribonucleoprotein